MKRLSDAGPEIVRLERTKELEETNYKYFQGTLEKARVDEALDPSKMPNISAIQRPSPPGRVTKTRDKIALGFAGGGLALGLGLALLFELVFNHSYKRRSEVEHQLRSPVMLSIPYQGTNGRRRLPWKMVSGPARKRPIRASPILLRGRSTTSFVPIRRRFEIVSAYISSYMELPTNQSWLALQASAKAREPRLSLPGSLPPSRKPVMVKFFLSM
jgi:Uncharacterized protein involved in exopolysaccharide biosynthesis